MPIVKRLAWSVGKPASALSDILPDTLRYRGDEVF